MLGVHVMTFRRYGRSLHYRIRTAEDLRHVPDLDDAHWVATGAPLDSLQTDRTFLDWLDTDGNGRLMCFEVKQAIQWLFDVLREVDGIAEGRDVLALSAVNEEHPEGAKILRSAGKILARLGAVESGEISLDQVRQIKAEVEAAPVSEKGVVLPEAAEQPEIRQFLSDVVFATGGAAHPGGAAGVGRDQLDAFFEAAEAHLAWRARADLPKGKGKSAKTTPVMPLGADTPAAFAPYAALADRVDEYFAQCEAVALDGRAAGRFRPTEEQLEQMDLSGTEQIAAFLSAAPLADPRGDFVLDFEGEVNPHYAPALAELRTRTVAPALGEDRPELAKADWQRVKEFYAAHAAWRADKAGQHVEPLGPENLREYLDKPQYRETVQALIAASAETAFVLDNIRLVEKVLLYQANLLRLANNFVSFPYLYDPADRAMFELGSLVMDGRRFEFCVSVPDRKEHVKIAREGNMYVMYLQTLPTDGTTPIEIAVAVTSGGQGKLHVGKRGAFEDIYGRQYDVRVAQIVANPISLGEAFASPFKRLGRLIGGKIESIATKAEKRLDQQASATFDTVKDGEAPQATKGKNDAKPQAAAGGGMGAGGLIMGGGVALAALGSSLAYIFKSLADVGTLKLLIGLAIAILAVILPTSILSILKLRRRDLSSVLEGGGWAINARMRLTRNLSRTFTRRPAYPKGAWGVCWWQWSLPVVLLLAAGLAALGWYLGWWR